MHHPQQDTLIASIMQHQDTPAARCGGGGLWVCTHTLGACYATNTTHTYTHAPQHTVRMCSPSRRSLLHWKHRCGAYDALCCAVCAHSRHTRGHPLQVADMAAKLTKYRAEVPASLQTCITAVLAHDAAALATHAGAMMSTHLSLAPPSSCTPTLSATPSPAPKTTTDIDKENATMHNGANSPVAMLPETLPDEMREACRRLPVLRCVVSRVCSCCDTHSAVCVRVTHTHTPQPILGRSCR